MWARQSFTAASIIAVLLLIDVGGVPFYTKTSASDWVVQLTFGAVGIIGLAAWVQIFRMRRQAKRPNAQDLPRSAPRDYADLLLTGCAAALPDLPRSARRVELRAQHCPQCGLRV